MAVLPDGATFEEFTEYVKVVPLAAKEPPLVVAAWRQAWRDAPVKAVRTDNGGELDKEFRDFVVNTLKAVHDRGLPGRPSTNSRIEDLRAAAQVAAQAERAPSALRARASQKSLEPV